MIILIDKILYVNKVQVLKNNELKNIIGAKGIDACFCVTLGYSVDCEKYDQLCPLDY